MHNKGVGRSESYNTARAYLPILIRLACMHIPKTSCAAMAQPWGPKRFHFLLVIPSRGAHAYCRGLLDLPLLLPG
jgi:hypothetical protein